MIVYRVLCGTCRYERARHHPGEAQTDLVAHQKQYLGHAVVVIKDDDDTDSMSEPRTP